MKNLVFCSPFVAQQVVNLLNDNVCVSPPGTSRKAPKLLQIKGFGAFYFFEVYRWGAGSDEVYF